MPRPMHGIRSAQKPVHWAERALLLRLIIDFPAAEISSRVRGVHVDRTTGSMSGLGVLHARGNRFPGCTLNRGRGHPVARQLCGSRYGRDDSVVSPR